MTDKFPANSSAPLVIFDLDDTLVDTSHVYWEARTKFLGYMNDLGFDAEEVLSRFEEIDTNLLGKYGHAPERYLASMRETYGSLCKEGGGGESPDVMERIQHAGDWVIKTVPELIPDAIKLLEGVKSLGFAAILLTRGVEAVQKRKIELHGLEKYFSKIEVVSKKDSDLFASIMKGAKAEPSQCWVVGDSIKSDINPAIIAGANCILYLYTHHSYYWRQEYGASPVGKFRIANNLIDVLSILGDPNGSPLTSSVPERSPHLPL